MSLWCQGDNGIAKNALWKREVVFTHSIIQHDHHCMYNHRPRSSQDGDGHPNNSTKKGPITQPYNTDMY